MRGRGTNLAAATKRAVARARCILVAAVLAVMPGFSGAVRTQQEKPEAKAGAPAPAPRGKKLVLKDGSFHLVRSYEQKGDRVRYYSVERSAWEEIPAELVDWGATRKAEAEDEQRKQEMVEKMREREAAARAQEIDVDASIELAPGVFLPEGEGLWALEGRVVVPLSQVGADVKLDKRRLLTQVFIPVPIIPTRHKVQIAGKQAQLRLTTSQPEFYFRTADAREPEMQLIRARIKGNAREIQLIDTNIIGQQATQANLISIQRWKLARGVYRLTMSQTLEPGEYALAEFLPGEGINLYVWDFGLDLPTAKPPKD